MKPYIVPVAVNIYSRAERPVSFGLEGQRETLQCASKGTEREEGPPGSVCSTGLGELVAQWVWLGQEGKRETLSIWMASTRSRNQRLKVGYLVCALWKGGKQNQGLHLAFPIWNCGHEVPPPSCRQISGDQLDSHLSGALPLLAPHQPHLSLGKQIKSKYSQGQ